MQMHNTTIDKSKNSTDDNCCPSENSPNRDRKSHNVKGTALCKQTEKDFPKNCSIHNERGSNPNQTEKSCHKKSESLNRMGSDPNILIEKSSRTKHSIRNERESNLSDEAGTFLTNHEIHNTRGSDLSKQNDKNPFCNRRGSNHITGTDNSLNCNLEIHNRRGSGLSNRTERSFKDNREIHNRRGSNLSTQSKASSNCEIHHRITSDTSIRTERSFENNREIQNNRNHEAHNESQRSLDDNSIDLPDMKSSHARRILKEEFEETEIFKWTKLGMSSLPRFQLNELVLGKLLGEGSFGIVKEISKINKLPIQNNAGALKDNPNISHHEDKYFMIDNCIRKGGNARYAIKCIKKEYFSDPNSFYEGAIDLAIETYFLAAIAHPNIIKMRGIAAESINLCSKEYFIVLDRLYDTLEVRIKKWKKLEDRTKGVLGNIWGRREQKRKQLLDKRLAVGFDLAAALSYLHDLAIVHRDLKPDNIGFDVRGDVKIFDFGLAKQLSPSLQRSSHESPQDKRNDRDTNADIMLFDLSGKTGSLRYMAPEVYRCLPYNQSADIYSFGILMWEIFSLKQPYEGYTMDEFDTQVMNGEIRPEISQDRRVWSNVLKQLVSDCWSTVLHDRPNATTAANILKNELIKLRGGNAAGLEHTTRRSTHSKHMANTINAFEG